MLFIYLLTSKCINTLSFTQSIEELTKKKVTGRAVQRNSTTQKDGLVGDITPLRLEVNGIVQR